mmetsp:Transcript_10578/g.31258  ORF Transcript_10578/g.31258 Transcript_10578/m.31258 type:complete len:242 (+) Transcript_10578:428-1153(+)
MRHRSAVTSPAAPEPLGAPLDALARAVRPLCDERTVGEAAVDTSLRVVRELVRGLRHEPERLATVYAQLLQRLLDVEDGLLTRRCEAALQRPHGLIGYVVDFIASPSALSSAGSAEPPAAGAGAGAPKQAGFSAAARCYLVIRLLLEVLGSSATAAAWLDAALSVAEVEAMAKWLKAASNSSMLGRSVGRARLLSFSRRRPYERSTSQQGTLDDLKGFRNLKRKTLTAKGKAAGGGKEVAG